MVATLCRIVTGYVRPTPVESKNQEFPRGHGLLSSEGIPEIGCIIVPSKFGELIRIEVVFVMLPTGCLQNDIHCRVLDTGGIPPPIHTNKWGVSFPYQILGSLP